MLNTSTLCQVRAPVIVSYAGRRKNLHVKAHRPGLLHASTGRSHVVTCLPPRSPWGPCRGGRGRRVRPEGKFCEHLPHFSAKYRYAARAPAPPRPHTYRTWAGVDYPETPASAIAAWQPALAVPAGVSVRSHAHRLQVRHRLPASPDLRLPLRPGVHDRHAQHRGGCGAEPPWQWTGRKHKGELAFSSLRHGLRARAVVCSCRQSSNPNRYSWAALPRGRAKKLTANTPMPAVEMTIAQGRRPGSFPMRLLRSTKPLTPASVPIAAPMLRTVLS